MKRLLFAGVLLCLPFVVFAQTMNVHTISGTDSYNVSNIDSITFVPTTTFVGIEMVTIPAGNFLMGSTAADTITWGNTSDEFPQHTVYFDSAYQISKYQITNAQYKIFMDDGGYVNSAYWTSDGWTWRTNNSITEPNYWSSGQYNSGVSFPNHPVVGISWYEAYAFCRWVGGHLPSEAQWERAARTSDARCYPWGSIWDASKCNCTYNVSPDTFTYSAPVGIFNAGQSPYGIFDMAGNAFEWINDWYQKDYYSISPSNNPTGPVTGTSRVIRGGSYYSNESYCRCAGRSSVSPESRGTTGFRVAK